MSFLNLKIIARSGELFFPDFYSIWIDFANILAVRGNQQNRHQNEPKHTQRTIKIDFVSVKNNAVNQIVKRTNHNEGRNNRIKNKRRF